MYGHAETSRQITRPVKRSRKVDHCPRVKYRWHQVGIWRHQSPIDACSRKALNAGTVGPCSDRLHSSCQLWGYRNRIGAIICQQGREKLDLSKLEGEELKEEDCIQRFLHMFQWRWKEETWNAWNTSTITENLVKLMIKKSMRQPVQKRLDGVVGLMEWPLFTEHIVHHVE